jgi:hypothetical protein
LCWQLRCSLQALLGEDCEQLLTAAEDFSRRSLSEQDFSAIIYTLVPTSATDHMSMIHEMLELMPDVDERANKMKVAWQHMLTSSNQPCQQATQVLSKHF